MEARILLKEVGKICNRYTVGIKPIFVFGTPSNEYIKVAFRAYSGAKYAKANSY
jgi:hypothetical protein